ncbi:unnamed protein product [Lathyrus sativus]|nr:unnamed protein product [Lathyrus sativus]
MEFLSRTIIRAVDEGHWKPNNGPHLSYLFFADDVLFMKVSNSQVVIISHILNCFAMFFNLKVNVAKSKAFFSASTKRIKIDLVVSNTYIKKILTLVKYLGFPMLHGHIQCKDFEFPEAKIGQRLTSWQCKLLNKIVRLTMVRYVLNSIPNYHMQVAWLPQPTCEFIDMMANNVLWKGDSNADVYLIGLDKITKPKKLGGLGI